MPQFLLAALLLLPVPAATAPADPTCAGLVTDAAGAPLSEVRVSALLAEPVEPPSFQFRLLGAQTTTADGKYQFALPGAAGARGIYIFVAEKPGLAIGWANFTPSSRRAPDTTIVLGPPATLSGTVVDEAGAPLAGVELRATLGRRKPAGGFAYAFGVAPLTCLTTRTDAAGRFAFARLPADCKAHLLLSAPGRATLATLTGRRVGSGKYAPGPPDLSFTLPPEARAEGVVVDPAGKPVSGVTLRVAAGHPDWLANPAAVSATDGRFVLAGLPGGPGLIEVVSDPKGPGRWVTAPCPVALEAGKTRSGLTIALTQGCPLEVAVLEGPARRPIPDATVYVTAPAAESRPRYRAPTGADGVARFTVAPGDYRVQATSARQAVESPPLPVSLAPDQSGRVEVVMPARRHASGLVRGPDGRPLPGAWVSLQPGISRPVVSDASGGFDLNVSAFATNLAPAYLLVAREPGRGLAAVLELKDQAEHLDLKLQPAPRVTGQVLDHQGQPLPKAVVLLLLHHERSASLLDRQPHLTDAQGRFSLPAVPAGFHYTLNASADGFGPHEVAVDVKAGAADDQVALAPFRLRLADKSISGIVVDDAGQPAAKVRVQAHGVGQPRREVTTNAAGRFAVDGLCAGLVDVDVIPQAPGGRRGGVRGVQAGATDVRIVLGGNGDRPR